jgi:hypothetical protein
MYNFCSIFVLDDCFCNQVHEGDMLCCFCNQAGFLMLCVARLGTRSMPSLWVPRAPMRTRQP